MPQVTGDIPNFINGLSQQAPAMRLPSQSEEVENFYPTVVDGCTRRPPAEFLADLEGEYPGAFTHIMIRDDVEKYVLVIQTDGTPRVYDFDGVEKTLTNSSGSYLTTGITNVLEDYRALTVADYTFIVNRTMEVEVGTATSTAKNPQCLINVLAGNYGKTYRLTINGVVVGEYQTPDGSDATHTAYIDTSYIAAQLVSDMVTAGYTSGDWSVARYGNVIHIVNVAGTDFTVATEDGYAQRAMVAIKDRIQKFSDLPLHGPDGFNIKVVGQDGKTDEDYYVEFSKTNSSDYAGVWREAVAPDTRLGLDAATMPHQLVRNADGTFTLEQASWGVRVAGDDESNVDPSFVGQTIQDVFFHKNRLGLLTEENAVLSESGSFFNFYRTTMLTLLDTDVIDIAASHVKVSLLHHAVPFNAVLLVFSDQTQFALKGNELLTPKTAHMDPLTELSSMPHIRPVGAGSSIYFLAEKEAYASLNEYFLDKASETADSEDVAAHAPNYIPAGVHSLAASSDLNLVAVATSGDPDAIYTYKFLWNGQEKIQSAWSRWVLPGATVLKLAFDRNKLVVLLRRNGSLRLETINCEQGGQEEFYLDTRVLLASGSYDAGTNKTTYTLPFACPADLVVVTAAGGALPAGVELTPTTAVTTFTVDGDHSAQPVYAGLEYTSWIRLSEQFYRDQNKAAVQAGRLTLRAMDLNYDRAAYFRVEVTPQSRATRTYPFNGRIIGDPENETGSIVTDGGRFSFPIMSRSDRVTIDIINDTWLPSSFISAKWKGTFNPNSRQL